MEAPPQLFVEVKGYLELVNTVDAKGNRTNDNALLLKLINAPAPLTPAEAEKIRQIAEDALKSRDAAIEAQKKAEAAKEEAAASLSEAADILALKQKEVDEKSMSLDKALADAQERSAKATEAAEREKKRADALVEKKTQELEGLITRLKTELARTKNAHAAEMAEVVAKIQKDLKEEKKAADEMMHQASMQVTALQQQMTALQEELEKEKARAPTITTTAQDRADLRPPVPQSALENMRTPTSSVEIDNTDIERMISEHNNWVTVFDKFYVESQNSNLVAQPPMPDEEAPHATVRVVEQILDFPGKEIFAPEDHFVTSREEQALYRHAMRAKDESVKTRILTDLSAKRAHLLKQLEQHHNFYHPPIRRCSFGSDRQYLSSASSHLQVEEPSATRLLAPHEVRGTITQSHGPVRYQPQLPRAARWFCCRDSRCCKDGGLCSTCCDQPPK